MQPARAFALVSIAVLFALPASTAGAAAERSLSPYFMVEGGEPGVAALPLKATSAVVNVTGVIAEVTVTQTYQNAGERPLHARYVFPASTRAAVHGMRMTIGKRVIEAKIAEREKARAGFEQAKREGKSASLLEQDRPNVFSMNIANILPGDRIDVELRYTELIVPTDGVYELVYPTVVGPRYSNQPQAGAAAEDRFIQSPYTGQGQAPSYSFALSGRISSPIAIQDLSIPTHRAVLAWPSKSEVRFSLDPSERAGGNRDLVLRYRLAGAKVQSGLLLHQGARENFFLLMVEPPARVAPEQIPPREYIFIVDVSGSMYGFPLDTAKALLRKLAGGLRPVDSFNVILFSGRRELLAPRSVPASRENIDRALAIIDARQGGGGTELLPALREAMSLRGEPGRSRSFVVVTDGYIAQEKEAFHFIRRNLGKANVFSFGIGSSVNRHLVEGVARAGMGEPFVVTEPGEAPAIAARFQAYIESPVLTDIEVSYDELAAYDVQPLSVPDLMARRPIIIHGKWAGEARGTIAVRGKAGNGNYRVNIDVSRSSPSKRHQALSYLWARSRLADLADLSGGGETEEEKEEVIALGLTYNLLTRHTSFLAVHQEVRNRTGGAAQVAPPLPLPDGVSDYAVGVESGSEPELLFLLALLVLALLGTRGRRRATPAPHA